MKNNKKLTVLTLSLQNEGHGTLPRQQKMAKALKTSGFKVIWISPPGKKNQDFNNVDLKLNFLPDFFF